VAPYGPPSDFHNQPTKQADFGAGGDPPSDAPAPPIPPDQSEPAEPLDEETEVAPWYRSPPLLIAWALLVLILIGLIIFGIGELIGGGEGTSPAPSTSTATTSAPASTTTLTTTPPPSTTTPMTPPTTTAVQPPIQQQPTQQPTQEPTQKHHPHLPPLPSVIRIPEGPTVTLPFSRDR
jgi:hypothetical protein